MSTVPNGHERTFMTATVPSLASGAVASAVAKTAIAPFDRTKINFQVSSTRKYSLRAALKFVKVTYQTTGFLSLYRGNSATLARIAPYGAIRFGAYEEFKHLLRVDRAGKRTPVRRYLAGSMAGITSSVLLYPLDTAKARLSVSTTQEYLNLRDLIVKEYRQSGLAVFYRGMVPTLLGVIPYAGLSFGTYETLKVFHKERTDNAKLSPLLRLCFGAFAGLVGQTPSYPLDIVRRRMQTGRVPPGQGVWRTLLEIWRTEGLIGGLYKGLSMNWIKGPVASGTSFLVYDLVFNQLRHAAIVATTVG